MLQEQFLKQLNPLHYLPRQNVLGRVGGRQLSKRKGSSLDFAEHRNYMPGDDYRYIDWNLYGRLDRLFVRVFAREEDYPVYILMDQSKSMTIGDKLPWARQLAATLGYIALKDQNRLGVYPFANNIDFDNHWSPRSGWQQTINLFDYLESLEPQEETDFNYALSQFVHLRLGQGMVLVISDMFSEQGYEEGLISLKSAGYDVVVFQVLARRDVDPRIAEESWLTSTERGPYRRRLSGPESIAGYLSAVQDYNAKLQEFCYHYEIGYLSLPDSLQLEQVVFEQLRGRLLT